jgi:hypothetical protein
VSSTRRGSPTAMAAVGARVRVQAGARVAFYWHARKRGEGRWSGAQHNGGRRGWGKAAASQPHRQAASGIAGRVASVLLGEGDRRGEG